VASNGLSSLTNHRVFYKNAKAKSFSLSGLFYLYKRGRGRLIVLILCIWLYSSLLGCLVFSFKCLICHRGFVFSTLTPSLAIWSLSQQVNFSIQPSFFCYHGVRLCLSVQTSYALVPPNNLISFAGSNFPFLNYHSLFLDVQFPLWPS